MTSQDLALHELDNVRSVSDALAFFAKVGVDVADYEMDGIRHIEIVKDKDALVGVPFLLLQWRFNEGQFGTFVSAEIVTQDDTVLVLNDGSTGIAQQLKELTEYRERNNHPTPYAGRMVKGGLSRSDYTYTDDKGKEVPATTYYLAY